MSKTLLPFLACAALTLASPRARPQCPRTSSPQPATGWQTKTGQLAYTDQRMSLIGEVLVRYSKSGDFELTFTKGRRHHAAVLRQDANFARRKVRSRAVAGPARSREAPARLRGWFQLRDKIVNGRRMTSIRHDAGEQSFTLRF